MNVSLHCRLNLQLCSALQSLSNCKLSAHCFACNFTVTSLVASFLSLVVVLFFPFELRANLKSSQLAIVFSDKNYYYL